MGVKCIFFGAKVDKITVGIAADDVYVAEDAIYLKEGKVCPVIDLFYPSKSLLSVVEAVEEMKRLQCIPEVFIDVKKCYVVVVFKFLFERNEFFRRVISAASLNDQVLEDDVKFVMTAEAEFESSDPLKTFNTFFEKEKCFYLSIVAPDSGTGEFGSLRKVLWQTKLSYIHNGIPELEQLEK